MAKFKHHTRYHIFYNTLISKAIFEYYSHIMHLQFNCHYHFSCYIRIFIWHTQLKEYIFCHQLYIKLSSCSLRSFDRIRLLPISFICLNPCPNESSFPCSIICWSSCALPFSIVHISSCFSWILSYFPSTLLNLSSDSKYFFSHVIMLHPF